MDPHHIRRLTVSNFRTLAKVSIDLSPVNVFFGPNGAGKTTLLDTLWLLRDCAVRGVGTASSYRNQGVGMLCDWAEPGQPIEIGITTADAEYNITLGLSSGTIEPRPGERLTAIAKNEVVLQRAAGFESVEFLHPALGQRVSVPLRQPDRLSLETTLVLKPTPEMEQVDQALRVTRRFDARSFGLFNLKTRGCETSHEQWLFDRAENLWSALRNLRDRRAQDDRYARILETMREAFPSFDDLEFEQTGPTSVYAQFLERGLRQPVRASGASDGHLQMRILLTALYSDLPGRNPILLFDEPELSLHPWALAAFAKAVADAADEWGRQILIATHSPVLLSQFDASQAFSLERGPEGAILRRVDDIPGVQDLLKDYALGSLYMAEAIGAQSDPNRRGA